MRHISIRSVCCIDSISVSSNLFFIIILYVQDINNRRFWFYRNKYSPFFAKEYELLNIDIRQPQLPDIRKCTLLVDIIDYEKLRDVVIVFSPDYIIHLAARTDLDGKSINDYSANVVGVKNLMSIAKLLPNLKK